MPLLSRYALPLLSLIPRTVLSRRLAERCRRRTYSIALSTVIVTLSGCENFEAPQSSFEVAVRGLHSGSLSADGDYALVGSIRHGGSLWRLADGQRLFNWNHIQGEASTLLATAFSHNRRWAASSSADTLVLWDVQSGAAERFWTAPSTIEALSLSAKGDVALLGLDSPKAAVFRAQQGGIVRELRHSAKVSAVALSHDGQRALTGTEDGSVHLWSISSGERITQVQHRDEVTLVEFSADDTLAVSASKYDRALVWDAGTGSILGEIPLAAEQLKRGLRLTAAAFSSDNGHLLTGRADGVVQLWDAEGLRKTEASLPLIQQWRLPKRKSWQPASPMVLDVAFADDGRLHALSANGFLHTLTDPRAN